MSHAKQAASADYYRQFHLYFLKGKDGSELDSTIQLRQAYRQVSWTESPFKKLTQLIYLNYTAQQEALTPQMQRLRRLLHEHYGDDIPQDFRDAFRRKSLPMMKYTNMLSFNTRTITLFISVIIQVPWLYFAFELLVLNLMLLYMILTHERFCRSFANQLETV